MEEAVDYQAMAEKLQQELEQARLTIIKMRYARNPLSSLTMEKVRQFAQQNYLVILVVCIMTTLLLNSLKTLKFLWEGKGNHRESSE